MAHKTSGPDLLKYIDKRAIVRLDGKREVMGVVRGFDDFMNLVLDETQERRNNQPVGPPMGISVIRGAAIHMIEALEPIPVTNYAPKTR
jgi:small nuclear ribonucleoprotein G